jgi:hypothetical protein
MQQLAISRWQMAQSKTESSIDWGGVPHLVICESADLVIGKAQAIGKWQLAAIRGWQIGTEQKRKQHRLG